MKPTIVSLALVTLFFTACNNNQATNATDVADSLSASTVDPAKDWKFGVALWTFHTVDFPHSLDKVDSAGLKYIEPNTFHKTGVVLKTMEVTTIKDNIGYDIRYFTDPAGDYPNHLSEAQKMIDSLRFIDLSGK